MALNEIVLAFVEVKGQTTCIAGIRQGAGANGQGESAIFGVIPPYTPERLPPKGVSRLGLPPSVNVDLKEVECANLFPMLRSRLTIEQWKKTADTGIAEMMVEVSQRRPFFAAPCNETLCFSIAFRLAESGLMMPNLFSATLFPEKDDFTQEVESEIDILLEESISRVLAGVSLIKQMTRKKVV